MPDITAFREAQERFSKPGTKPWWDRIILTPEQHASLEAALDDPTISARVIATVLTEWQDVPISLHQVGHYRRMRRG